MAMPRSASASAGSRRRVTPMAAMLRPMPARTLWRAMSGARRVRCGRRRRRGRGDAVDGDDCVGGLGGCRSWASTLVTKSPRSASVTLKRVMRFAYVYFMKPEPDRVRAIAPHHAAYWQQLALRDYRGGPFADRSGGLITFDAESPERAEELVSRDPFLRERLLERHSIKEWITDTGPSLQRQGTSKAPTCARSWPTSAGSCPSAALRSSRRSPGRWTRPIGTGSAPRRHARQHPHRLARRRGARLPDRLRRDQAARGRHEPHPDRVRDGNSQLMAPEQARVPSSTPARTSTRSAACSSRRSVGSCRTSAAATWRRCGCGCPRAASASWDWTARHLLLAVGGRSKAVSLMSASSRTTWISRRPSSASRSRVERPTLISCLDVRPVFSDDDGSRGSLRL